MIVEEEVEEEEEVGAKNVEEEYIGGIGRGGGDGVGVGVGGDEGGGRVG